MSHDSDAIEMHERLAKIETKLETMFLVILESLKEHKQCDEKQDEKLDKILKNDKDKLQRITRTEEGIKNIKAMLLIFIAPIAAGVARWFV